MKDKAHDGASHAGQLPDEPECPSSQCDTLSPDHPDAKSYVDWSQFPHSELLPSLVDLGPQPLLSCPAPLNASWQTLNQCCASGPGIRLWGGGWGTPITLSRYSTFLVVGLPLEEAVEKLSGNGLGHFQDQVPHYLLLIIILWSLESRRKDPGGVGRGCVATLPD